MTDVTALTSTVSTLVLALPFAVLAVLLALLVRRKGQRGSEPSAARAPAPDTDSALGGVAPRTAAPPPAAEAAFIASPASLAPLAPPENSRGESAPLSPVPLEDAPLAALPSEDGPPSSEPLGEGEDEMIKHIGPIPDPKTPEELHLDIQTAERAGNHALLARLCLDLAQATPSDPRIPEVLRKCVRAAMRSKSFAVHAAARLELAERARLAGDLTTACEHWQIARGLFFDMNDRDLHKTAEGLMLRHGCPTDWVLTDF